MKIKHGHSFYNQPSTGAMLRDDSGEIVEIDRTKPIRISWGDGRDHADIPCVGGGVTPEPVAGALLLASELGMEISTDEGTFTVVKKG